MPKQKVTKKEKKIFWAGVSAGIIGGLIGGIFTTYLFRLVDDINPNKLWYIDLWGTISTGAILFLILFFINNQIKKNL